LLEGVADNPFGGEGDLNAIYLH
jgi:hypothetical protein